MTLLLIQNAKQVPLIDTKWLKKMHAKNGVMGHVCPIVAGAADLGKKGLLIPEVNLIISITRAPDEVFYRRTGFGLHAFNMRMKEPER